MKIDTNALIMAQVLGGGGSSVTVEPLSVTANGEYTAPTGKAFSPVTVNVAKPDYLISDGDLVSTFYFNTAYALGTWLATLTYSDLDPDTGLYVCYTGLGYFFGVDLTSGQYALVWNDGVNIVPIYSTVAVPAFGVTEAGWQMASYTPSVATTVVEEQIIPALSEVIDEIVAKDDIAFGIESGDILVPFITAFSTYQEKSGNLQDVQDITLTRIGITQDNIVRVYAGQSRTTGSSYTKISNDAYHLVKTSDLVLGTDSLTYTFQPPATVTGSSKNAYAIVVYYEVENVAKVKLNSDGSADYIQTSDFSTTYPAGSIHGAKVFIPTIQNIKRAYFNIGVTVVPYDILECSTVEEVEIASGVTKIRGFAFGYCERLTSIDIPETVTEVEYQAFEGCSSLQSIILPGSNITKIGNRCFQGCTSLMSITVASTEPPTLGESALYKVPATCAIYVPSASVSAYQSATRWSDRAAYIQAIPS